jgi:hypothetical protein
MTSWKSLPDSDALGSRAMARRGHYAVAVFTKLGVSPAPSGRLPTAIKLLRRLNDEELDLRDPRVLIRAANAQRTVWEFFVIAYVAELRLSRATSIFPLGKIELALGGSEIETDDKNHIHRNTQFELYTAALLCLGSAEVSASEPDFLLTVGSRVFGVAAKRLSSLSKSKIKRRLLDGAKQILTSTREGYIAINIDGHFRGNDLPSIEDERHRLYSDKAGLVSEVITAEFGPLTHVRGIIIYGHLSAWDLGFDPPHYTTTYPTSYQLFHDEDRPDDYSQERSFWTGYTPRLARQLDYLRSPNFSGP